jgi:hypothetical protein
MQTNGKSSINIEIKDEQIRKLLGSLQAKDNQDDFVLLRNGIAAAAVHSILHPPGSVKAGRFKITVEPMKIDLGRTKAGPDSVWLDQSQEFVISVETTEDWHGSQFVASEVIRLISTRRPSNQMVGRPFVFPSLHKGLTITIPFTIEGTAHEINVSIIDLRSLEAPEDDLWCRPTGPDISPRWPPWSAVRLPSHSSGQPWPPGDFDGLKPIVVALLAGVGKLIADAIASRKKTQEK